MGWDISKGYNIATHPAFPHDTFPMVLFYYALLEKCHEPISAWLGPCSSSLMWDWRGEKLLLILVDHNKGSQRSGLYSLPFVLHTCKGSFVGYWWNQVSSSSQAERWLLVFTPEGAFILPEMKKDILSPLNQKRVFHSLGVKCILGTGE